MCFNLGIVDRVVRTILGVALIAYGVAVENYIIAAIGIIPIVTVIFGFCPFYYPFNLNSGCKREGEEEEGK